MIVLRLSPYLKLLLINITLWAPVHAHERRKKKKIHTPCGTQTRNLQIRSLTRYSIAPTGLVPDRIGLPEGELVKIKAKQKIISGPAGT